ncbi:CopG family transcriptional regulator [bacterium]|nr:CopG family transcriptional regulator [bacterium]
MEQRIGTITILIMEKESAKIVNSLLSDYSDIILARQGLPIPTKNIFIISLIIEATTEQINALTGKIGRLKNVEVKSVLTKFRGSNG